MRMKWLENLGTKLVQAIIEVSSFPFTLIKDGGGARSIVVTHKLCIDQP